MSKLVRLGSQFQVNAADGGAGGIAGNQISPRITALADGRFAVAYQSDLAGSSTDIDPKVMIFNADGSFSTSVPITPYAAGGLQTMPVIAARADGGFGMVFTDERHLNGNAADSTGSNIVYVPVSASGVVGAPIALADFNNFEGVSTHDALLNPVVATLSGGRQVVAFEQVYSSTTDHNIRMNVVGADGASLQFDVADGLAVDTEAGLQTDPAIAAGGNNAMIVYRDGTGVSARIFDGGANTLGNKLNIATNGSTPVVTALDSHRFVVVYQDSQGVKGKIYDTATATLSSEIAVSGLVIGSGDGLSITATSDGGFAAAWIEGLNVHFNRFDSSGAILEGGFYASFFSGGYSLLDPAIAMNGDRLMVAWSDMGPNPGDSSFSVQAQMYTLASSGSFSGAVLATDVLRTHDRTISAASLFATSGFTGNAVTKYQFGDSNADASSGYWIIDGVAQAANVVINVTHAQLENAKFVVGAYGQTDTLHIRASDSVYGTAWKEFHVTATNQKPTINPGAPSWLATHNQVIPASSLFSVADADGDTITQYRLWDTEGNGHWIVNGVVKGANTTIVVTAAELAQTVYQAGGGTDHLYVQAFDGSEWGNWSSAFTVTGPANHAPTAAAVTPSQTLGHGGGLAVTSLFSSSDADGDSLTQFSLWDTEGNGAWYLNGVKQATNAEIVVQAADLANVTYVSGAAGTTDHLYLRAYDGIAWSGWALAAVTSGPNQKPVVTPTAASRMATHNQSLAASSLFTSSDGDSDTITAYQLWDTQGNGHWIRGGMELPTNTVINVLASDLTSVIYMAGAGTDELYVRAFDGHDWSNWSTKFTVTGPADLAPTVAPVQASRTLGHGVTSVAASSLFTYSDPENDSAVKYSLWDSEGNGHWVINGVVQATAAEVFVTAAQLAQTSYVAGASGSTDHLYVRAFDGSLWSNWSAAFTVTAGPNQKPVATSQSVYSTQTETAASAMFDATDGDNDTITKYQLWDANADPTSGYWSVGGVEQAAKVAIDIDANQVASTAFVTRGYHVNDDLYVRAFDGTEWSSWVHFVDVGDNHAPTITSAPDVTATHKQSLAATGLFTADDPEHQSLNYELWDSTADPASGHWVVNGAAQAAGVAISVTDAELANTFFQSGSGSDTLYVRAYDGALWSDWKQFHVNAPVNYAPVVGGDGTYIKARSAVSAASLFSETDADNDAITAYEFWDNDPSMSSGYFIANGGGQGAGRAITVTAAQLATAVFVAGAALNHDTIYERAFDGLHWSDWHSVTMIAS